jgi:hypothetical protein
MEETVTEIRKSALQNAVRYEKPPKVDAVLKKILGENPELRKDAKQVYALVKEEIARIESMSKTGPATYRRRKSCDAIRTQSKRCCNAWQCPGHNCKFRICETV